MLDEAERIFHFNNEDYQESLDITEFNVYSPKGHDATGALMFFLYKKVKELIIEVEQLKRPSTITQATDQTTFDPRN